MLKACKCFMILFALIAILSCKHKSGEASNAAQEETADTTNANTVDDDQLIRPGEGIGKISLDEDMGSVQSLLGRPDKTDAAMGSALMTWFAGHDTTGYQTSIFGSRNMGGKDEAIQHIKRILVTSPWFKTEDYISTGNTINDINKFYILKKGIVYTLKGKIVQVYTEPEKGISFEIDAAENKCISIIVHKPNDTAAAYINMH